MEAPPGMMSADEFNAFMEREVASRYEKRDNGWFCKKCGAQVEQTTCYVSEHEAAFQGVCAGTGGVENIPLPYCPACEGKPTNVYTCVHLNLVSA